VVTDPAPAPPPGCEPYDKDNLLDRLTPGSNLEAHYRRMMERERQLVTPSLGLTGGEVLSVGAGWHPGRHLFPAPAFRITAVDADPQRVAGLIESGRADAAQVGYAGRLGLSPCSCDVVLYRLEMNYRAF